MGKWQAKYDQKRLKKQVSFNQQEQELFMKMFGEEPNSPLIKEILFSSTVTKKVINIDESLNEKNFQLKKIGGNLNQIAWHLNANKSFMNREEVDSILEILHEIKSFIKDED